MSSFDDTRRPALVAVDGVALRPSTGAGSSSPTSFRSTWCACFAFWTWRSPFFSWPGSVAASFPSWHAVSRADSSSQPAEADASASTGIASTAIDDADGWPTSSCSASVRAAIASRRFSGTPVFRHLRTAAWLMPSASAIRPTPICSISATPAGSGVFSASLMAKTCHDDRTRRDARGRCRHDRQNRDKACIHVDHPMVLLCRCRTSATSRRSPPC